MKGKCITSSFDGTLNYMIPGGDYFKTYGWRVAWLANENAKHRMKIKLSNWFPGECKFLRGYLLDMEVMAISWEYERRWIGLSATPVIHQFFEFELYGISGCEPILWWRRKESKECQSSQDFLDPWSLFAALIGNRENIFVVDCWDGSTQKEGGEKLLKYRGRAC